MKIIKKLQEELSEMERELKVVLPRQIREAASHGDLSENAEYDAAKERQRWVNARMAHLRQRIQSLSLVDLKRLPVDRVAFGSTVELEEVSSGERKTYRMVHPEEVDAARGLISLVSPVGQSLTGKSEGDEVVLRTVAGPRTYVILKLTTLHDQID